MEHRLGSMGSICLEFLNTPESETAGVETETGKRLLFGINQKEYDDCFEKIEKEQPPLLSRIKKAARKKCTFTRSCFLSELEDMLPCIRMLRTYQFRNFLLGDIVAGLSLTVLVVPQSMGYAMLASVPPIVGLYTSFFPVLIYFLFGTCQHLSIGTMALSSLIIGSVVKRETQNLEETIAGLEALNSTAGPSIALLEDRQMSIAVGMTLLSGILLTVMSCCRLGFIVSYVGDAFMSGYLTGANICVVTTQLILILQVQVGVYSGTLGFVYTVIDILCNIPHLNVVSLLISIITIPLLLVVKYCVNARFKSKLKVPVPIEIIVVIIAILASHFGRFEHNYGVRVVKNTPRGIPRPVVPNLDNASGYVVDTVPLALVSYIMMCMMGKLLGQRHDYSVRPNQELLATGLASLIGAFFSCINASTSPPRCFLMESTGGHTQVAFLVAALGTLIALLVLAPLLQALPVCVLACLIIVACIPLFEQYRASVYYWRTNKYDFATWITTVIAVIVFCVSVGLFVGMAISLFLVILRSQNAYATTMGILPSRRQGEFADLKQYRVVRSLAPLVVFRFTSPLYFATSDIFKRKLFSAVGNPRGLIPIASEKKHSEKDVIAVEDQVESVPEVQRLCRKDPKIADGSLANAENVISGTNDKVTNAHALLRNEKSDDNDNEVVDSIVIDCSAVSFIDTTGAKLLGDLHKEYELVGVRFALAACTEPARAQLDRVPQCEAVRTKALFPTVRDAVLVLSSKESLI